MMRRTTARSRAATTTTSRRSVGLFFLFTLAFSASATTAGHTNAPTPPFKIVAMKAMLFYENNGTFSDDVAQADFEPYLIPSILWNSTIEGASRVGASSSVLVRVEVAGEYSYTPHRKVEFTARYIPLSRNSREIIVRRRATINISENGKYVAGFWLYETGCNPVKLSARIIGQREASTMKRVIKFGCGE